MLRSGEKGCTPPSCALGDGKELWADAIVVSEKTGSQVPRSIGRRTRSTGGFVPNVAESHSLPREKLQSRGFMIADEFNCAGLDTTGPLKLSGGIDKGRPSAEDLKQAEESAQSPRRGVRGS